MALIGQLIGVTLASAGFTGDVPDVSKDSSRQARRMEFQLSAQGHEVAVNVPVEPVATVGTTTGGVELEVYTLNRAGGVVNVVVAVHNTTDARSRR